MSETVEHPELPGLRAQETTLTASIEKRKANLAFAEDKAANEGTIRREQASLKEIQDRIAAVTKLSK